MPKSLPKQGKPSAYLLVRGTFIHAHASKLHEAVHIIALEQARPNPPTPPTIYVPYARVSQLLRANKVLKAQLLLAKD